MGSGYALEAGFDRQANKEQRQPTKNDAKPNKLWQRDASIASFSSSFPKAQVVCCSLGAAESERWLASRVESL
jgi:hypothetical protein